MTLQDSLRPLQDWEANKRCMRSIFNIGPHGPVRTKKHTPSADLAFGFAVKQPTIDEAQPVSEVNDEQEVQSSRSSRVKHRPLSKDESVN